MSSQMKMRLRFSLRTLLILIAFTAILIFSIQWYIRTRSSQTIEVAVATFNSQRYSQGAWNNQSPLTPRQIFEYLDSNDETITQAPPRAAAIFRKILKTGRIPNGVQLNMIPLDTAGDPGIEAFSIGLEIMDKEAGYRLDIRTIDVREPTFLTDLEIMFPTE